MRISSIKQVLLRSMDREYTYLSYTKDFSNDTATVTMYLEFQQRITDNHSSLSSSSSSSFNKGSSPEEYTMMIMYDFDLDWEKQQEFLRIYNQEFSDSPQVSRLSDLQDREENMNNIIQDIDELCRHKIINWLFDPSNIKYIKNINFV